MVSIREVTPADAQIVADLREAMFLDIGWIEGSREEVVAATVEFFARAIAEGTYIGFIAEEDGVPVGTAGAVIVFVPPYAEDLTGRIPRVQNVYVVPEYRRQGVARELFARLIERLRDSGLRRISLMATDEGRSLYEEFGFEDVPEMSLLLGTDQSEDAE